MRGKKNTYVSHNRKPGSNMLQITPDIQDLESAAKLTPRQVEYMVQEIQGLHVQIHEYLRNTPNPMNLALIAAGTVLTLALPDNSTQLLQLQFLQNIALLVFPLLMGIITIYNLNVASEVAALAEIRDRLSYRVNRALGKPIYILRVVSDLRRGSYGTIAAYSLAGLLIFGTIAAGLWNAIQVGGGWLLLQSLVTLFIVIAIAVAFIELSLTRVNVNAGLDAIFGNKDRPSTAPSPERNKLKQLLAGYTVSKLGKNKEIC